MPADQHAPVSIRTGQSQVQSLTRMAGVVTVEGGGDREGWPGQLCACSQTTRPPPPQPGQPQPRGTVPRRAGQAWAGRASRLPGRRAGLPAPSRGHPRRTQLRPSAGAVRFRRTRRGRQRPDHRLPRAGEETTRAAERGHGAPPASWLSRLRHGPAPGAADRGQASAAPHLTPHTRRRPVSAARTPAATRVRTRRAGRRPCAGA